MARHTSDGSPAEQRRREAAWKSANDENRSVARQHFRDIARSIGVGADAEPAFITACMEVARRYATDSGYANYALRTGHPWPDEGRDAEERRMEQAWRSALEQLEKALTDR